MNSISFNSRKWGVIAVLRIALLGGFSHGEEIRTEQELSPFVVDNTAWLEQLQTEHPKQPREFWLSKLDKIKLGLNREQVEKQLAPYAFISIHVLQGGSNWISYALDKAWSVHIGYNNVGRLKHDNEMLDVVLQISPLQKGGWENDWRFQPQTHNPVEADKLSKDPKESPNLDNQ